MPSNSSLSDPASDLNLSKVANQNACFPLSSLERDEALKPENHANSAFKESKRRCNTRYGTKKLQQECFELGQTEACPPLEALFSINHATTTESVQDRVKSKQVAEDIVNESTNTVTGGADDVPSITKRRPARGDWSKLHLLTNSRSKLTTVNLSHLFNSDLAWTSISPIEQGQLLSMIPKHQLASFQPSLEPTSGHTMLWPNHLRAYLKHSSAFQADIRLFQEDLRAGRYEPQWQRDAANAMHERARGDFDEWKEANRESFWGEKQKVSWLALAGDSAMHSLGTMVAAKLFKLGDVWRLGRGVGHGRKKIYVEKEATIIAINEDDTLTFSFPPGLHKFSSEANGKDVIMEAVNGPTPLSNAMLTEDGRIIGIRGANAWREFRCLRQNQDMGTLWDIRELYHQRYQNSKN